ncbi:hypothetical protein [Oceanobacillus sp. Castelsardo]|uniref:hypothetical protein n=1 Tax=Oceanobacillus sp. Castelsardo TaxID=1851204 RepID=UPI0008382030|nr:hypothetical protein [Oceanobacillus sp. Castelsardo]
MSVGQYHALCQRYRGRAVEIRTRDGRRHRGIIQRVSNNRVFIQPLGRNRNLGGFGYGYGYGYGGFGYGLALGAIVGLALLPFFFW